MSNNPNQPVPQWCKWHVNTGGKTHSSLASAKNAVEEYYQSKLLETLEVVENE